MQVTVQDMADTYQPPFESCVVQGKASGIMCAYNRVNGVPSCADHHLLTALARKEWKFNGLGFLFSSLYPMPMPTLCIYCFCIFVPLHSLPQLLLWFLSSYSRSTF